MTDVGIYLQLSCPGCGHTAHATSFPNEIDANGKYATNRPCPYGCGAVVAVPLKAGLGPDSEIHVVLATEDQWAEHVAAVEAEAKKGT